MIDQVTQHGHLRIYAYKNKTGQAARFAVLSFEYSLGLRFRYSGDLQWKKKRAQSK
jgi:hypothetical protein